MESQQGDGPRILGQIPDGVRDQTDSRQRAYLDYWRGLAHEAVASREIRADIDLAVATMLLAGALNWAVEWYRPEGELSPEDLATQVSTMVFDGVAKQPSGHRRLSSSTTTV